MLQTIRDKITGWFASIFLGAIAVVFIFWGVELGSVTGSSSYAAKVNGDTISLETVQRAWQERQSQLQQSLKTELPEELKKQQQDALMNEFIRAQLLSQRAEELGFRAGDAALAETLYGISALQVDGKFSRDRYKAALAQQGLSEAQFEEQLRGDLEVSQLQNSIIDTAFITPAEFARLQTLEGEQRDIDYALFSAKRFEDSVVVTDAEVQTSYQANKNKYLTPETVDLQYVELRLPDTAKEVEVTDEALRGYYDQIKDRYESAERRHARHILIAVGDGVDDAAAKKQAEEVLAKVNAGGDFVALARQNSKDPGSAANGGDLGWAGRGMFVAPFEEALFGMSVGEVRGPIKTQFGYHIIKLDEIEAARSKPFEEVRAEVEAEYRNDRARSLFYDKTQQLADAAFSSLTELDSVAQKFGVPLQTVPGFTREGGGEFGGEMQVIEAAFSEPVLAKGENSPLVTLGEDRALVLRATGHKLPEQQPLEQVRPMIVATLKSQAARAAAEKQGAETLGRLQKGELGWAALAKDAQAVPAGKRTLGRQAQDVPPAVLEAAFAAPKTIVSDAAPAYRGVALSNGDYAVVAVSGVHRGVVAAGEQAAAERTQRTAQLGSAEFSGYLTELERAARIQRNDKTFE